MNDKKVVEWSTPYVLKKSLGLLPKAERTKIIAVAIIQFVLSFLDLVGVAIIGVIGALAVNGISSKTPGTRASLVLDFLGLTDASLQKQIGFLALGALLVLIGKTLIAVTLTRRVLFYLARVSARMSASLIEKMLASPFLTIQNKSIQEQMFAVTSGISTITVGIIGISVSLVSDMSLTLILTLGLFIVEPTMALINLLAFILVGTLLHQVMHTRAQRLGENVSEYNIRSSQRIFEILTSYREAFVKNRRGFYARSIGEDRMKLAETSAELGFMPQVSKYVIEVTLIFLIVIVCGVQFLITDASRAVGVLAVFMAASLRIAPAILRIQQSLISVRASLGTSRPTLELIESYEDKKATLTYTRTTSGSYQGFSSIIEAEDICFRYPGSDRDAIHSVSFEIAEGEIVALVGPSGGGKTTLADLVLGILTPQLGNIRISGVIPIKAIEKWSGAIAYVPQDVMIMNGTIKENICMGFEPSDIDDEAVWKSLDIAQLSDFVQLLPERLSSQVGDRGTKLSGGQRQRLGIARALITQPKLLVLDEATSALDGETEANLSAAIQAMRGTTTVIMIAHRLSTVRSADKIIYMNEGSLVASGTFGQVRELVVDFDRQAQLMGL